jgi:hypothetical protein
MLAWVVINRRHLPHSTPTPSPLRLCVQLSDSFPSSFPFISHLPYTLPSSVSCNPCVCHSYENCRGVYQQFPTWNHSVSRLQPSVEGPACPELVGDLIGTLDSQPPSASSYPLTIGLLPTLLRVFALPRNATLFLSSNSALFRKNTRLCGMVCVQNRTRARLSCFLPRLVLG